MKFSVLMSVYYKEKQENLTLALESIVNQTSRPDELVLVKDGKLTKELDLVVESFAKKHPGFINIVTIKENKGLGLALRRGVKKCRHDIIARMDSDDVCHPTRFEKQIQFLIDNPAIQIVGSNAKDFIGNIKDVVSYRIFPEKHEDILKFSKRRCPLLHPTTMFRKEAIINAGNYEHFLWFEDYHLFIRLLRIDVKFHNIQEELLYFRSDENLFRRRGGLKYLLQDIRFQIFCLKSKHVNFWEFSTNLLLRISVRILPNNLRDKFYKTFLRKNLKV